MNNNNTHKLDSYKNIYLKYLYKSKEQITLVMYYKSSYMEREL